MLDALQLYVTASPLTGEHKYKCPNCKCLRDAEQCHRFTRLPSVLVLKLQRFKYAGSGVTRKVAESVEVPLSLDMSPYVDIDLDTPPTQRHFSLYGAVNHSGSLESGHYVANVRHAGDWYACDDKRVSKAQPHFSDAYILFYHRE